MAQNVDRMLGSIESLMVKLVKEMKEEVEVVVMVIMVVAIYHKAVNLCRSFDDFQIADEAEMEEVTPNTITRATAGQVASTLQN